MIGPGENLDTLAKAGDHLGVLRYIRAHELRKPEMVLFHGQQLLGENLSNVSSIKDDAVKTAALEQICLSAIDTDNHALAEICLDELKKQTSNNTNSGSDDSITDKSSSNVRYERLLGRCLEAANDYDGALSLYDKMLKENPSNLVALQRKYCILRSQMASGSTEANAVVEALNEYLGQQLNDVSGWYEMSQLRLSLGDYKGAAFALEQVVLGCPIDADIHRQLGEVYSTIGGSENISIARKHMAQALELDPTNVRAQMGLMYVANQYLEESAGASKKNIDEHERSVAKELVRYGADEVLNSYKERNQEMYATVKRVIDDYTSNIN